VRAQSVEEAFFGQGYAHAEDRWWQMCYDRRRAQGRLAEWLGSPRVRMDAFARRMGLAASARSDYDAFDDETRTVLRAYAEGVNAWLAAGPPPPVEFELLRAGPEPPWEPWDCGAVFKLRHVLMGSYSRKVWRAQLIAALGAGSALVVGGADGREDVLITGGTAVNRVGPEDTEPSALACAGRQDGSNSWALDGSRTRSGLPLVAGDPHRALEAPNVYYQNHVACDEFDAIGLSMTGVPGMFHFGHNATVAWCVTHAYVDDQDLFIERFGDDGRYEFRGERLEARRRSETIHVRDGDDVRVDVVETHHGPVVFGNDIAMRWTGTDGVDTTLTCLLPMLRATTVDELDATMRGWVIPGNNFLMADRAGTIGYLHRGRAPVRPRSNGWAPVPGWTGDHEWDGAIPFEEMPRLRNPDTGWIVTANNRVTGDDYPHYLSLDYGSPYRAERIVDRVDNLRDATAEDMASIHADRVSIPGQLLEDAVTRVLDWDLRMEADSAGALLYAVTREQLAELLCEREPLSAVASPMFTDDPLPTPAQYRVRMALPRLISQDIRVAGEWDELIAQARDRALVVVEKALGTDRSRWRWDAMHSTKTRHPVSRIAPDAGLDPPPVSAGGDNETVNVTGWETGLSIEHGSVARYVFDLADWDNSGWVVPLGASGDPRSAHYADQAKAWSACELFPMTYDWARVQTRARSTHRLDR
jgi:penicillin amidase